MLIAIGVAVLILAAGYAGYRYGLTVQNKIKNVL